MGNGLNFISLLTKYSNCSIILPASLIILPARLKGPRPGPGPKNYRGDRTRAMEPYGPMGPSGPKIEPYGPIRPHGASWSPGHFSPAGRIINFAGRIVEQL